MGSNSINLAVRFLLELSALVAFGAWGWKQGDGVIRYVLALGIPIAMAVMWGVFAVPDDPSRSGSAPVVTPGFIRLVLELAFFAVATWCLREMELTRLSIVFGILVVVHYAVSYDRILWLLKH